MEQLPREDSYSSFFLSPDGKKAAVDVMNMNSAHDIWIYEFGRNTMQQTSDPANDFLGVWSPDGKRLAFGSSRTGSAQMYLTTAGWERARTADYRRDDTQVPTAVDP